MTTEEQFNEVFHIPGESQLPADVLGELESIARTHSITPQDVFIKWESYCLKMGPETKLSFDAARALKLDIQESLERDTRGRVTKDRKTVQATPRAIHNSDDVLGMFEGSTPKTPASAVTKRKSQYETPANKVNRSAGRSSPVEGRTPASSIPFAERQNAGQTVEQLNGHLHTFEAPLAPYADARIKLKANSDVKKFFYKPMAMHLSEASEVLDDRIDEFAGFVQVHHDLDDSAFGNAASKSTNELVAVGRIASDSPGKLSAASIVLEMSRRTGAGVRVPLKFADNIAAEFFPGQIVAVRGTNSSGEYFAVSEVLDIPLLPPPASLPSVIEDINAGIGIEQMVSDTHTLNVIVSAGPYTADDNLDFEPLHALCERAIETCADAMVLSGPFLDIEHPLIASGDFDLPPEAPVEPDKATLTDAFRWMISEPLRRVAQAVPSITIVMVPSARDAANKHVSWPQEPFTKKELGLPIKQTKVGSNPVFVSLNESVIGVSGQDVLWDLRYEEVKINKNTEANAITRYAKHVIQQRHFYPVFPPTDRASLPRTGVDDEENYATGTPLDTSYLKLGEWLNVRPDILIVPSNLMPFVKVVESVLVINPGTLSKRRGAGTYAQLSIHPRTLSDEEQADSETRVQHKLYERTRVDITKI